MWSGFCPSECSSRASTPTPFTIMAGHIEEVQHLLPAGTSEIGQQSDWHGRWCCKWRRCRFLLNLERSSAKVWDNHQKYSPIRTWWPCGLGLSHGKKMFFDLSQEKALCPSQGHASSSLVYGRVGLASEKLLTYFFKCSFSSFWFHCISGSWWISMKNICEKEPAPGIYQETTNSSKCP